MTNSKNTNIEKFKNDLKRHGLKATPQRLAVHEAMMKLGHASADMVTEEIRKSGTTKVTVASVYNILSHLALLGKHMHIYDCENHEFKDVIDEELLSIVERHLLRRKFKGYRIENIDIQLIGRPSRRKAKPASI